MTWLDTQKLSARNRDSATINKQVIVEAMTVGVLSSLKGILRNSYTERAARRVRRSGRKKFRGDRS